MIDTIKQAEQNVAQPRNMDKTFLDATENFRRLKRIKANQLIKFVERAIKSNAPQIGSTKRNVVESFLDSKGFEVDFYDGVLRPNCVRTTFYSDWDAISPLLYDAEGETITDPVKLLEIVRHLDVDTKLIHSQRFPRF